MGAAAKPAVVNQMGAIGKQMTAPVKPVSGNPLGTPMLKPMPNMAPVQQPMPNMAGKSAVTNMPTSPVMNTGPSGLGALATAANQNQGIPLASVMPGKIPAGMPTMQQPNPYLTQNVTKAGQVTGVNTPQQIAAWNKMNAQQRAASLR